MGSSKPLVDKNITNKRKLVPYTSQLVVPCCVGVCKQLSMQNKPLIVAWTRDLSFMEPLSSMCSKICISGSYATPQVLILINNTYRVVRGTAHTRPKLKSTICGSLVIHWFVGRELWQYVYCPINFPHSLTESNRERERLCMKLWAGKRVFFCFL